MKVKMWLGGIFKALDPEPSEEFEGVKEVHLNFTNKVGPRTKQIISGKIVAVELSDSGNTYRFQDVEEIEITEDEKSA